MSWRRAGKYLCLLCALARLGLAGGSEHHGQVVLNDLPVPGASVTASSGDKTLTAVTDEQGNYFFPDLTDGTWTVAVGMTGFSTVRQDVSITFGGLPAKWELKLLPLDQVITVTMQSGPLEGKIIPKPETQAAKAGDVTPEASVSQDTSDGLLINGSVNNGAASPFSQAAAFGNNRSGPKGLYTGGIGMIFDNSTLDAKPFSLTGQNTPKPAYNDLTGIVTLGGPLRIPHILKSGPNFFVGYQWTRDRRADAQSALVPDLAERNGIFSNLIIPPSRISRQAQSLLALYPLPNFSGSSRYNYQIPTVSAAHQDALQSRFIKTINNKNQISGLFAFQSIRSNTPNVLGFSDTSDILGISSRVNWTHRLKQGWFLNLGYQFSRLSTRINPYFENRTNVSGNAGIEGNNQAPVNWGPPTLVFASGIASLTDGVPAFDRNQTNGESASILWEHGPHSVTFGGDFRRQQFNYLSQQDPRGTFTFTGAATGVDFADFLLGVPDTSSIAFGNADKYFRESVYDGYVADDWRVNAAFTLNAGMRWEYAAPTTELYNRLVNLDIAPGFSAVTPILASNPMGPLTGKRLPNSLIRPDKSGWEPRVGIAWRPLSGSSLVIRGGYGIYYNTSVYQSIDTQLAQQPPLSKTLSVQNSATDPLTLANGFNTAPSTVANTFAIDPDFRVGYAQVWQMSIQRDLPASLLLSATYSGIKGTRGLQEFLPNTFPAGAVNQCAGCPAGYIYLSSNGNSTREAGSLQLRRRLHSGFTALAQYTFSKSIDDVAALGGQGAITPQGAATVMSPIQNSGTPSGEPSQTSMASVPGIRRAAVAQNWRNLKAERALSSFDQRHLLALQMQYTSGMGLSGGTLLNGWRGTLLKEWTFATQITAGSGLPLNPVYLAAVAGTGVTGTIRPDYTGAGLYAAPAGLLITDN